MSGFAELYYAPCFETVSDFTSPWGLGYRNEYSSRRSEELSALQRIRFGCSNPVPAPLHQVITIIRESVPDESACVNEPITLPVIACSVPVCVVDLDSVLLPIVDLDVVDSNLIDKSDCATDSVALHHSDNQIVKFSFACHYSQYKLTTYFNVVDNYTLFSPIPYYDRCFVT
jgi:hypothetical protein